MRDEHNDTLLHWAACDNSTSCLRVLLRFAPHHLDAVNKNDYTPLMKAVKNDNRDDAKLLLRSGANVWKKNNLDHTVFDIARLRNKKEMLELLKQHQQVSGIL